jgi:NAD/NADP transhydrogenase beta subunit
MSLGVAIGALTFGSVITFLSTVGVHERRADHATDAVRGQPCLAELLVFFIYGFVVSQRFLDF